MQRKFQYIMLGAGLTLLVLIGAFAFLSEQAQAGATSAKSVDPIAETVTTNTDYAREQSRTESNDAPIEADHIASEKLSEREAANIKELETMDDPLTETEVIIQTVTEFVQKREESLLGKSGWIHVVTQPHAPEEERGSNSVHIGSTGEVVPRDELVPDSAQFETWYHVDETGVYNEAMSLVTSPDGVIHQQSVLVDNQWLNLTLRAKSVTQSEYMTNNPSNEIALPAVTAANSLNEMTNWENVSLRAQAENGLYVVSAEQTFEKPVEDVILAEPVLAGKQVFTFDAETGQLLMNESHLQLSDGTWILREKWTYSTTEFVRELPASAAEVFSDAMRLLEEK